MSKKRSPSHIKSLIFRPSNRAEPNIVSPSQDVPEAGSSKNSKIKKPIQLLKRLPISLPKPKTVLWLAILATVVFSVSGYLTAKNELTKTRAQLVKLLPPEPTGNTKGEQLASQISRYIELPKDEAPALAIISNAEQYKSNQFFSNAKNGDQVLVYARNHQALIYRPSTKKVIEYSKINIATN